MKKRIALAHPRMRIGGGSEARPLWIAEALKKDYRVDLITMGQIDLNRLNQAYGTDLKPGEINVVSLPIPRLFLNRFDALRGYRLHRYCRRHAKEYDVMISTYNAMDFGKRGIQFIADFSFDDAMRESLYRDVYGPNNSFYKKSLPRTIYLNIGRLLSGNNQDRWTKNLTISNSHWSRMILLKTFGMKSTVIYPPVVDNPVNIPWNRKTDEFVIMGRISPEKQIDRAISLLRKIRNEGFNIKIKIIGRIDDKQYGKKFLDSIAEDMQWISYCGLLTGKAKNTILASSRYGISACRHEAFGIAVAEMVKSGSIVWVPNSGGQTEIVKHPRLIYSNESDAIEKISGVLRSQRLQGEITHHLARRANLFTSHLFMKNTRRFIDRYLQSH